MNLVISGPIDESLLDALKRLSAPSDLVRLHPGACRLIDVRDAADARTAVAALCDAARVDHAYVENTAKLSTMKLLAMDMDSTLITIECIDEIADFIGKKPEVAAITEATMRGEIRDFAESLRRRVALLAGTPVDVLGSVFDERLKLTPGAKELLAAAKLCGIYTLLVSGGFTYFTDRLRADLGLDEAHANTLEERDGKLTGRVIEPIVDSAAKANRVAKIMNRLGADPLESIVIGDGANDIPMMERVFNSIAYHAKPAVKRSARFAVTYGTLATVLDYLQ